MLLPYFAVYIIYKYIYICICIHLYIYIFFYIYLYSIDINIILFISLNVYKCLMCCAATDRTACESGQVKNTEIQQRLPWFRTLGMTLSRGKSPQAAKHPFWNNARSRSSSTCPSVRSLVTFFRDHFYQPRYPRQTPNQPPRSSRAIIFSSGLSTTVRPVRERRERQQCMSLPSNLIHSFPPASHSLSRRNTLFAGVFSRIFMPRHHFYLARVDT